MADFLTIHVERDAANHFYVTCDQHKGLLVVEDTLSLALERVVPNLLDLLSVGPAHPDPKAFDGVPLI